MSKRFCKPISYFPMLSFIMEMIGIVLVLLYNQSICIQAREVTFQADFYVVAIGQLIIPDFIFFILVAVDSKNSIRPVGVVYNVFAFVLCITATVVLGTGLSLCGNIAQYAFICAMVCGMFAALFHFGTIYEIGMRMPQVEKFAIER